jgi:hypothetical protein
MMRHCLVALMFVLGCTSGVMAQGSITNEGNCNVNIIGSGNNNFTVQCSNPNASQETDALLVFTNNSMFPVGGLNAQFINGSLSTMSVSIEDDVVLDASLDRAMPSARKRLAKGQYYYEISIDIMFWNGRQSETTCGGILNVQASAVIMPRIYAIANMNGDIFPQNCGFELRM